MSGMRRLHLRAEVRGQRVEKVLRADVGRAERGERDAAEHRRHVDDVARAALLEVRQHLLHPVERRLHVHAHHVVDVVVGELRRRCA